MRNLKRLQACGIPCPEAIVLRLHVLVMSLIGDKSGWVPFNTKNIRQHQDLKMQSSKKKEPLERYTDNSSRSSGRCTTNANSSTAISANTTSSTKKASCT